MRFDVVTLFPEMFDGFAQLGVVGRAVRSGAISLRFLSPREFGVGKHHNVDDTPYGGGAGMVMRVDCLVACLEALDASAPAQDEQAPVQGRRVLLTPQGQRLDQSLVVALAARPALTLICGRYEGFDDRIRSQVAEEVSIGDFVMSGGELGAMVLIDSCSRLLSGVVGNPESLTHESHTPGSGGLLEYPQFTRPAEFRGDKVPAVLLSGDHAAIETWRREQALARTAERRPELVRDAKDERS